MTSQDVKKVNQRRNHQLSVHKHTINSKFYSYSKFSRDVFMFLCFSTNCAEQIKKMASDDIYQFKSSQAINLHLLLV